MPPYLQEEYNKLSEAQKRKFYELLVWAGASGLSGVNTPLSYAAYDNILAQVKQMGSEPITPAEPDRTVNHDWNINPKQGKNS